MPDGPAAGAPASLEDLLGPSEGRYFAAGYRGVVHSLAPVAEEAGADAPPTTTATVRYPRDWSTDGAGRPRTPHLSSVDAVILVTLAFERVLGPDAADRWISDVELRGGTEPWWDLDAVPVTVAAEPTADGTRLSGKVGNIRAVLQRRDSRRQSGPVSRTAPPRDAAPSVYGDAFRRTVATTRVHPVDRVTQSVRAAHRFTADDSESSPAASGIEAAYPPALTVLDYLVTMGQLTQVLVFELAGTGRAAVGNLWMRSLRILGVPHPEPLPATLTTTTTLVRDRLLTRAGSAVHDVLVVSEASNGVRAEGKLAWGGAA